MNGNGRWQPALAAAGAFLAGAFLLWLFALRDFTDTAEGKRAAFEGQNEERANLFEGSAPIQDALREAGEVNAALKYEIGQYLARMAYHFTNSSVPEEYRVNRQQAYLLDAYEKAKNDFRDRFANRQVACGDSALRLGYDSAGWERRHDLLVEEVEEILRCFEAVRRTQFLLDHAFSVEDDRFPDGNERALLAVHELSCAPPAATGIGGDKFMREYRVTARVTISPAGLMKLLRRAGDLLSPDAPEGTPTPFHAVRKVEIKPATATVVAPPRRAARDQPPTPGQPETVRDAHRNDRRLDASPEGAPLIEQWFTNYYDVTLELATIQALVELDKISAPAAQTPSKPRRATRGP